jgi:hypothetical protein
MSVKVLTKIGTIKFFERKNSFKVKCKGYPSFVVRKNVDNEPGFEFQATKIISSKQRPGVNLLAIGKSAKECYKNAVRIFWFDQITDTA